MPLLEIMYSKSSQQSNGFCTAKPKTPAASQHRFKNIQESVFVTLFRTATQNQSDGATKSFFITTRRRKGSANRDLHG